jgi:hypothetical protein
MTEFNIEQIIEHLILDPKAVYELTPRQFEMVVAELLSTFGFEVSLTPQTKDGGRDIIARAVGPIPFTLIVETKKYSPENAVGVNTVRALAGYLASSRAEKGLLITTSRFTRMAYDVGKNIPNIELRDFKGLKEWLKRYSEIRSLDTDQQSSLKASKKTNTILPHAKVFPRIATTIDEIWDETETWVTRADIITRLAADSDIQLMLNTSGGSEWHIGNCVDWFSQKITAGESIYKDEFRRKKINGKWAYAPSPIRLHNQPQRDKEAQIAGPLQVFIDSDVYTAEEKGELLSLISELYNLQSGDRLVIDSTGTAEPIPVGVSSPDGGFR